MACLLKHESNFVKEGVIDNDYMTPKYAWENIQQYIPKDKVIWEAFMGDGKSGEYLTELGFNVIANDNDFFQSDEGDIVVSNPPFSISKEVITRLKTLDKPFILILPSNKINTQYFRILKNQIQLIIPRKRIHFDKKQEGWKNSCYFDCFYYCYKMNLPRDIIWLE
tara:strand:+ start:4503 stop:5000 length:498 start_codon:yes stop_codon:yes gene_type:complete